MRKEGTPYSIFYIADVVCKWFVTDKLVNNVFQTPAEEEDEFFPIPAENIETPDTVMSPHLLLATTEYVYNFAECTAK